MDSESGVVKLATHWNAKRVLAVQFIGRCEKHS